jgi:hypothetical protein
VIRTFLLIVELASAWNSTVSREHKSSVAYRIMMFLKANNMLASNCSLNALCYDYGTLSWSSLLRSYFYLLAVYSCSYEATSLMLAMPIINYSKAGNN